MGALGEADRIMVRRRRLATALLVLAAGCAAGEREAALEFFFDGCAAVRADRDEGTKGRRSRKGSGRAAHLVDPQPTSRPVRFLPRRRLERREEVRSTGSSCLPRVNRQRPWRHGPWPRSTACLPRAHTSREPGSQADARVAVPRLSRPSRNCARRASIPGAQAGLRGCTTARRRVAATRS